VQNILSIDATSEPAIACVVSCDVVTSNDLLSPSGALAVKIEVLEQHEFSLKIDPQSSADSEQAPTADSSTTSKAKLTQPALLDRLVNPYSSVVMVVRPSSFAALNMFTPISDSKALGRILELEVQDLVPFDVGEFAIAHRIVENGVVEGSRQASIQGSAPEDARGFDVHVGMMPKSDLASVIKTVETQGISPVSISSAPSVLALVHRLHSKPLALNSAVLRAEYIVLPEAPAIDDGSAAMPQNQRAIAVEFVAIIAGIPRSERIFIAQLEDERKSLEQLAAQIRLTLLAIEHQSNIDFEALYVIPGSAGPDSNAFAELLQIAVSGRGLSGASDPISVYPLTASELAPSGALALTARNTMAAFCAVFGHDQAMRPGPATATLRPLTNFRVRQFAPRPPLRELWRGFKATAAYVTGALILLLTIVTFNYFVKEQRLASLQRSLHERLSGSIPDFSSEPGQEVAALENMSLELSRQLKDLISPFSLSPLETLLEVSRDIPAGRGIIVRSIDIKGANLKVTGNAPDYGAIDELEKAFKSKRKIYRRPPKIVTNAGPGSRRDFTIEAILGEDPGASNSNQPASTP